MDNYVCHILNCVPYNKCLNKLFSERNFSKNTCKDIAID